MRRYSVTLTTLSPFAISRSRATGNQIETRSHIPGTVWRGALAVQLGPTHPAFKSVFLDGNVRFGDLRWNGLPQWPLSARCCARHKNHAIFDLLLAGKPPIGCPECGGKLVAPDGYQGFKDGKPERRGVRRRITAHTAISNFTLRVRPEQLFSTEIIESNQEFTGELTIRDAAASEVADALIRPWPEIHIGRGATRGQGLA
ncbi:MAG: hypothetical protein LC130_22455, partial [Bryobacterales bacterium]|nr:hypothetical protein [Bryobacterales bacterium]